MVAIVMPARCPAGLRDKQELSTNKKSKYNNGDFLTHEDCLLVLCPVLVNC